MQRKILKYFKLAAAEAVKNNDGRHYLLGCVAIRGDGCMVRASNGRTPVPMREMHAELRCSRKLDYGSTVYVVRVLRNGDYGTAYPCKNCLKALIYKKVKRIYYTISSVQYGVIHLQHY